MSKTRSFRMESSQISKHGNSDIRYSPGRWFASHLLKMIVSMIVINYDIEALADRPSNDFLGEFCIPSRTATARVRRRSGSLESGVA